MDSIYKAALLDHFHNPRNKGNVDGMHYTQRGRNPSCGDEVAVGVDIDSDHKLSVRFIGRGCFVCMASASMMSESMTGLDQSQASELIENLLQKNDDKFTPSNGTIETLANIHQHTARKKCVLLAWNALSEILDKINHVQ